jgi:Cu/Ag efflux protein CusF
MSKKPPKDYAVGYRKPPIETRFKKGRSGNPKGRPKGSRNFASCLREALAERVPITDRGQTRLVPLIEVVAKRMARDAAAGKDKMMRLLLGAISELEAKVEGRAQPAPEAKTVVVYLPDNGRDRRDGSGLPLGSYKGAQPMGTGTINFIDARSREVNVTHGAIHALALPSMTRDFRVAPSIDLTRLKVGSQITFSVRKNGDSMYCIESVQLVGGD